MKMMGMSARSASCCCSSRPLSPGSVTSSTRQHGPFARGRERNSCADTNVSGCQPALLINNSNDSRTETSSSTMKTIDLMSGIVRTLAAEEVIAEGAVYVRGVTFSGHIVATVSPHAQRGVQRIEQGCIAERLEQALHCAMGEQPWSDGPVIIGGDEHDRDCLLPTDQFLLKRGSRHPGHRDVEDQTSSPGHELRREKRVGRRESLGRKAELPDQVRQRLA